MRRPVGMATLGAQKFAGGAVGGHGIAGGLDRAEPEPPVLLREETPAQVHVGLVGILVLVEANRRGLPHIDLDARDGPSLGVGDAAVHEQGRAGRGRAQDAAAIRGRRGIVTPERAEQRRVGFGRSGGAVVHQADQSGEPDRVGEENALVVGVVRGLADAVEEVDGEVVFVLGQSDFARKGVEVADEGGHDLAQPRVGRAGHRGEDDIGDAVRILDDAVVRHVCRPGWCGRVHTVSS